MTESSTLMRAVRGPILLIALGFLFVLDQQTVSLPFYRTWPMLLILFGMFKLAESVMGPAPAVKSSYGTPAGGGTWQPPAGPPPEGGMRS